MANEPERPRSEPEIIPPDRVHDDDMRRAARGIFGDGYGFQRVYVARLGPFGMFMLALAGAAVAILVLLFLVGAFLLWIPIVGLLVAAAILSSLLRNAFQRPR